MKKLLVSGVLAVVVALAWNAMPASAHHPEVVVTTVCTEETPAIDVTAEAWESSEYGMSDDHRVNTDIRVDVDGPGVDQTASGQFVAPSYSFTSRFALPVETIGQTLTVRVTAVAPWGPNGEWESYPDFIETTVTILPQCNDDGGATPTTAAPTSTAAPTTSAAPTTEAPTSTAAPATTEAPATTAAPASTAAPTTSAQIPTEVEGITEVRPQVPSGNSAAAAQAGGQLAFTGRDTGPVVLGAAGMLAIGAGLVIGARKRRTA